MINNNLAWNNGIFQNQLPMSTPIMGNTTALSGVQPTPYQGNNYNTGIFSREGMFGQGGWFVPTAQALNVGAQLWQGMQQIDLMKDQLAFQKDVFAKNWTNQVQLTNQRLYDRYAARNAGYGTQAKNKEDYLATEGVK